MSKFNFKERFPIMANVATQDDSPSVYKFNGQNYLISVFLDNMDDIFEVPTSDIISIQIIDDMLGFNHTGTLKYKTPNFSSARFFNKIIAEASGDESCKKLAEDEGGAFRFRGSGSEMVHVKLQVVRERNNNGKIEEKSNDILMHTYVVTDIIDTGGAFSDKQYTLQMVGIERYILEQYKLKDFVAGNSSRNVSNETLLQLPDHPINNDYDDKISYRADKTGEAIYHIMMMAYNNWSELVGCDLPFTDLLPDIRTEDSNNTQLTGGSVLKQKSLLDILGRGTGGGAPSVVNYRIDVGDQENNVWVFKSNGTTKQVTKQPTDFWDFGSPDSCLFRHFGQNVSTWEVVNEYLKMHTSSITTQALTTNGVHNDKYDPCVLKLERPNSALSRGKVSLRPLVSYFNSVKLGDSMSGAAWMGSFEFDFKDNTGSNFDVVPKVLRPIFCGDEPTEGIEDFTFEPTSPTDASLMFRTHTTEYTKGGVTTPNIKDGAFENVKAYIGFNYIKPIYHLSPPIDGNYTDLVNVHNNGTAHDLKNPLSFTYQSSPTISAQMAEGRNKALKAFIFMNDSLSFVTKGIINRTSGMCFSATTPKVDPDDKILNRLNGVYLCSGITHRFDFEAGSYTNDILGVRFYE